MLVVLMFPNLYNNNNNNNNCSNNNSSTGRICYQLDHQLVPRHRTTTIFTLHYCCCQW